MVGGGGGGLESRRSDLFPSPGAFARASDRKRGSAEGVKREEKRV